MARIQLLSNNEEIRKTEDNCERRERATKVFVKAQLVSIKKKKVQLAGEDFVQVDRRGRQKYLVVLHLLLKY